MSSPMNEDQEQRKTISMEESNAMTIEFLRARLLSERSVSKTARQRADELAKRVAELEEQLKFVSLQRKKAEKATADVLAILENRGISDMSEEFDSFSEPDESPHEFNACNGSAMKKETSTNAKPRKNSTDAYSSSEVESSPSTGRSLSWKSNKDSQNSLEKKKYMDSVRRRASFASSSSSARRVGKSCRRIRRRETRSTEELQNDGPGAATPSRDGSNFSDGEPVALRESDNGKNPLESPTLRSNSETQEVTGRYLSGHDRDEDMESALQHQAQLIGRYEEEEKAQREWEEKFRENNSGTQDSCDPGNHSDVTEERYDLKSPELSCGVGRVDSDHRDTMQEIVDACFSDEHQGSKSLPSLTDVDKGSLQDEKCRSGIIAYESSASEFSFPMSKERSDQELAGKQHETAHASANISSSHVEKSTPQYVSPGRSSSLSLAVVPQATSDNLGSVLEALQRAKLSLNQKISSSTLTAGNVITPSNPQTNKVENFNIPTVSSSVFRLPTDTFETTTRVNIGTQSSFADFRPEFSPNRFLTEPFPESRRGFSRELFLTAPQRSYTSEIRPRPSEVPPSSSRTNHLDPYADPSLPLIRTSYPFLPDVTLRLPLNDEGTSRTFPSSDSRLPPGTRFDS
ncbi:hypothetical protein CDL12_23584 [Handroanthus impetiginosus]|uniref:Uncharacterized protein n=1 Tax=Handroanthus impetiginosus TaxID=429701 RepID=A0A2G9GF30_9LAMI|nr:hypothetical protein CDL12_23584 [Handroanthus impetiginosus]